MEMKPVNTRYQAKSCCDARLLQPISPATLDFGLFPEVSCALSETGFESALGLEGIA